MSLCSNCAGPVPDGSHFCPSCGAPIPARLPPGSTGPGTQIDLSWARVIVDQKIGEGGMGVVYHGWLYHNPKGPQAQLPPEQVAVKVLHPLLLARPHIRKLFVGEATALARLSHPNIVKFYGLVESAAQLAIVLEYVHGEALDQLLARHKFPGPPFRQCLPMARAWHYFEQLLGALAATHELGIVHRDVKPANILLRQDGIAKLTDFGIARLPADMAKQAGGIQPGTGAYMAPEQVLGQELDGRSDLYSAAIVLFEMLVGITPFDAPDKSELMVRASQVDDVAPAISSLLPGAPPAIDLLMARALAKAPNNRFQSALELGDAFRKGLGLPETTGWRAQRAFAKRATGMVPQFHPAQGPNRKKGGTLPIPQADAEAIRAKVASAYRR